MAVALTLCQLSRTRSCKVSSTRTLDHGFLKEQSDLPGYPLLQLQRRGVFVGSSLKYTYPFTTIVVGMMRVRAIKYQDIVAHSLSGRIQTAIIMPDDVALEKVNALRCLGATVERVRPASIIDTKHVRAPPLGRSRPCPPEKSRC